ncbi:MAG: MFS transporter [Patescibacteria group bacterium]|jgi:MFS family permease
MDKRLARRNVLIGYILNFLSDCYFPIAIWLFFYLRFLTFTEIGLITMVKMVAENALEVPTGAFADMFGRKISVVISFALCAVAMTMWAFSTTLWVFIILELVKALGNALYSGSMEALVYDSLKETKQEREYDQVIAHTQTITWIGLAIASILGGSIYMVWFQAPYIIQGVIYGCAAIIALFLQEPRLDTEKYSMNQVLTQNIIGFKELFQNKRIVRITLVLAIVGFGYTVAANILGISQLKEYGMNSVSVGVTWGIAYLFSATASQFYPFLKKKFGAQGLVVGAAIILICSFIFARFVGLSAGVFLIMMRIASSTTFNNVKSSLLNSFVSSKNRATAISSLKLLTQMPFALLSVPVGYFIDNYSPNTFALFLGCVLVVLLGMVMIMFKKRS